MSRLMLIVLLALPAFLTSCPEHAESPLRREAEKRAQKWWETSVARCGDDYYTRVKWSDVVLGGVAKENELYQLKRASYYVKENPVSEATKLNGIEWQGRIVVVATAHRKRYTDGSGWSAWSDGVPEYHSEFLRGVASSILDKGFNKEKGRWSIDEDGREVDGDPSHVKPACSEIPPG